jgi:hypothetical protein
MTDDISFPDHSALLDNDGDPTAAGIVQCLRMLAQEASSLRLARTLAALRSAMTICAQEGDVGDTIFVSDEFERAPGMLLH